MAIRTNPRRAVGALALAAIATLAGCKATASLSNREMVAHFLLGTTLSQKAAVGRACAGLPAVRLEPLPTSPTSPQARLNEVRYRVDRASNAQIGALFRCLQRFPSVRYVDTPPDQ